MEIIKKKNYILSIKGLISNIRTQEIIICGFEVDVGSNQLILLFQIGCEKKLYSNLTEDLCGICGGNNSSCQIIQGNLLQSNLSTLHSDYYNQRYQMIVRIPISGTLKVQHFGSKENLLAIKSGRKMKYK